MNDERPMAILNGEAAAETPAAASPLQVAIDAALAKLEDPTLTPIGFLRAALQHARAIPVHESRQAEAAAALEEFSRLGIAVLRTDIENAFARLPNLIRKFTTFSLPLPLDTDRWAADIRKLVLSAGWSSLEADLLLVRMLKPGERVVSCDAAGIRLETRTLTRRAIRDGGRPAWWKTAPGWNQLGYERQFGGPIPGERE